MNAECTQMYLKNINFQYLWQYALGIVDFESDFTVLRYVKMKVQHFCLFEHIRHVDVLISFYFLSLYHKAYRNCVSQFCCVFLSS